MLLLGFINNLFEGPSGLIILLLAILLFGAKRIPELARSLGSAMNEFNKAKNEVQQQISQAAQPPVTPQQPMAPQPPVVEPTVATPLPPQEPPKA